MVETMLKCGWENNILYNSGANNHGYMVKVWLKYCRSTVKILKIHLCVIDTSSAIKATKSRLLTLYSLLG